MKKVVIIEKNGNIKSEKIKKFDIKDLYKKCKFRKDNDFKIRNTWSYKNNYYSLYAKDKGRSNSENKYDLPPPVDSKLYFGSMIIIKHSKKTPKNNEVLDFEENEWLKLYEHLFGGFEDLGDEDSYSEDDEDIPDELKTKHGYLKDGFVVSSDAEDEEYIPDDEDEDEDEVDLADSTSDDEADYGGETDEDEELQLDDDEDDDDNYEDDDEDPASELSEEEYSY